MPLTLRRALLLAVFVAALAPAGAEATVTRSSVTSPADPTYRLYQPSDRVAPELTITGTSDGRADESVDVVCSRGALLGLVADNVPLSGDGTFTTDVALSAVSHGGCILRAVPHLYRGKELQPFDGPLVAVTYYDPNDFPVPVRGAERPAVADYYVETGNRRGRAELRSAGSRGLKDLLGVHPEALGTYTRDTWDGGASLQTEAKDAASTIEVDDRVAYAAGSIPRLVYAPEERPTAPEGFDGLEVELTLDERTGRVTVEESQRILRCNRWDRTQPRPVDCTSVLDTGVRLERTITFDAEHAIADVDDRWISTDGQAHRLRLAYEHDADESDRPLWRFPGDPRFTFRADQDRVRPKGPGTVFVRGPEGGMAVGALSYAPAPATFIFDGKDVLSEINELTVPAGGVLPIRRTFAIAENVIAAEALAQRTEDGFAGPAVSIDGPADGATTGEASLKVSGRATDNVGVAKLTINGQPVAVGGDGSFSAVVALGTGSNRVDVVATDATGLTGTASIDVTRTAPVILPTPTPQPEAVQWCVMPRVKKGSTVKAARAALKEAGCKAARKTKSKRSSKVKKGRVLSLTHRAGDHVPLAEAVGITVSAGRKKKR